MISYIQLGFFGEWALGFLEESKLLIILFKYDFFRLI